MNPTPEEVKEAIIAQFLNALLAQLMNELPYYGDDSGSPDYLPF